MKKLIISLLLIPYSAFSAPYWNVVPSTATAKATATLSGNFIMYPSTTSSTAGVSISGNGAAIFDTNTFVVDATNHRVGIGTASPSESLEVVGNVLAKRLNPNASASFRAMSWHPVYYSEFKNDTSGSGDTIISNYNVNGPLGSLIFKFSGVEKARLKGTGNFGIGTTAPDEKLHVVGNVKIDTSGNGLIFPDGTKQTSAAVSTLDTANITTRQTVLSGSIGASGYADFVAAGSGLNAEIQANADEPLIFAFANGYGAYGGADYIQTVVSTITVSVPASSTTYLYVTRDSSSSVTGHYTAEAPVYGYAHPSCMTNKFSYLIPLAKMYVCSGGVWTSTAAVFVGQATTGGSAVTSVTTYALRGEYDSGWFAISYNTGYAKNHNIGIIPMYATLFGATNDTGANMGYLEGDTGMADGAERGAGIGSITATSIAVRTTDISVIGTTSLWTNASGGLIPTHARIFVKRGW